MAEEKGRRNGNGRRRIGEFQHFTICHILGLSFDEQGLRRIFKELKLNHNNQFSAAYEMHQHLVQMCKTQSQHAKRVEKLLEKQFAPYKKEVDGLDAQKICEFIEGRTENILKDIPLSALIWFAARNVSRDKGKEIETRIFTAVHMKEHQALRFYDDFSRKLSGDVEDITKELRTALESSEKLQRRCARLEQKKEELISERETIKEDKVRLVRELEEQKRLTARLGRKVEEVDEEVAFEQIETMKKELAVLKEEIGKLNKEYAAFIKKSASSSNFKSEMKERMVMEIASEDTLAASACNCNASRNHTEMEMVIGAGLKGLRVAYVGGVESLEVCYKEMAESFGGILCYHSGHCERGKREIESIVEKNDVIFCPVDINSHNACQMIKETCKMRNKPCCFLRSSSLSALKKMLLNFTLDGQIKRGV